MPGPRPAFPDDRRQSMSRQPSFTYSEWTDAKTEDFFDLEPVPETPVFDCFMDMKADSDPGTLSVKPVGLQERSDPALTERNVVQLVKPSDLKTLKRAFVRPQ